MATKSTKTSKTSAKSSSKPATGKTSAAKKNAKPVASSKKAPPARSKTPVKTTHTSKSRPASSATAKHGLQRGSSQWLTLNRGLDITGIAFVFIGALVLLAMLSSKNGVLTGGLLTLVRWLFGLGVYVFPFAIIASGLWLVLRNFERIPHPTMERLAGFILLFLNMLTWIQWFYAILIEPETDPFVLAKAGQAGGYTGAILFSALDKILGAAGTAIVLIGWLLIALVMALDVSIVDLMRWVPATANRINLRLVARSSRHGAAPIDSLTGSTSLVDNRELPPRTPVTAVTLPQTAMRSLGQPAPVPVWVLPEVSQILDSGVEVDYDDDADRQRARLIEETLYSFGAPSHVVEINRGPTITQFGVEPDFIETRNGRTRVRVAKITSLSNDLALALSARTIRIEAPVPGKGFVGIEVPNDKIATVALRDVVESDAFKRLKSPLRFALGQNVSGSAVAADLAAMPHLLIAGQTGSGKSVCVNALICCLLLNNTPDDLRLIMVDPKRVELTGYNGIPHLLAPVVVDLERVVSVLGWVSREMDMRYQKLAEAGSRNIQDYNARMAASGQKKLPYLVVIVDELADLMMLAADETERTLTRLAQLSRATGIHLVIATQRPSVDVVTGLIKANFPARIAFAVASGVDSRVILDQPGAETLLGRGDMLFMAPDSPAPVRLQGVFVSDAEIFHLVSYWQSFSGLGQPASPAIETILETLPDGTPMKQMSFWDVGAPDPDADPMLQEAIDLARRQGRASVSMLQRRLRVGYTRAARMIEKMEEMGIVGPPEPGSGVREILDYGQAAPPIEEN